MNANPKYFRQKFDECSKLLNSKPNEIVSLKYRDIRDHSYYVELLNRLNEISGITIDNNGYALNGQAYSISYSGQKIILVEHETGLEILYIAGSVAGIIGLVLQIGSMLIGHRKRPPSNKFDHGETEIRYFDKKGKFIEDHRPNYLPYEVFLLPKSKIISDLG